MIHQKKGGLFENSSLIYFLFFFFLPRSFLKRSLSDGNINCESNSPLEVADVGQIEDHNQPFPDNIHDGNKGLSESTPEISTCESELSYTRWAFSTFFWICYIEKLLFHHSLWLYQCIWSAPIFWFAHTDIMAKINDVIHITLRTKVAGSNKNTMFQIVRVNLSKPHFGPAK